MQSGTGAWAWADGLGKDFGRDEFLFPRLGENENVQKEDFGMRG
jgi:hypothetical protein